MSESGSSAAEVRRRQLREQKEALKAKRAKLKKVQERRAKLLSDKRKKREEGEQSRNILGEVEQFIGSVTRAKPAAAVAVVKSKPVEIKIAHDTNFQVIHGQAISIDPEEKKELYSKSIQVNAREIAEFVGLIHFEQPQEVQDAVNLTPFGTDDIRPFKLGDQLEFNTEKDSAVIPSSKPIEEIPDDEDKELKKPVAAQVKAIENVQTLDSRGRREVYGQPEFVSFFDRASLLIERCMAINDEHNLFMDFSKEDTTNRETEKGIDIKRKKQFEIQETKDRPVTCVHWSKLNPELFLATYAASLDSPMDQPDGLLIVWNTLLTDRPEFIFQSQSMITVARFHPSNPKHILGCTLSGQVLLWDMKESKRTPVFRSKFVPGHTQAIFAMSFMPKAAMTIEQILTVSHDAKICVWRGDMLSDPHEMDFKVEGDNRGASDELTTSCFSLPTRDHNVIILGSDTGRLFCGKVYDDQNPQPCQEIRAHAGPVTNIQFHPPHPKHRLDAEILQLFLTSSYDWTVKIWDKKSDLEILCFDTMQDYVHDARWSPVHPAVFACVDGLGNVSIFNLNNKDHDQPVVDISVTKRGICRLSWSLDGRQLLFGDADGIIHFYDVAEELYNCTEQDVTAFEKKMGNLIKQRKQEREEEAEQNSSNKTRRAMQYESKLGDGYDRSKMASYTQTN